MVGVGKDEVNSPTFGIDSKRRYLLMGIPTPLARPRFSSEARIYDCQKQKKGKDRVDLERQQYDYYGSEDYRLKEHPLRLLVWFYMRIPKTSVCRARALENSWHYCKPDLSNLLKYVEDICKGIIIDDDSLIAEIQCYKLYSSIPRTEFEFEYIK